MDEKIFLVLIFRISMKLLPLVSSTKYNTQQAPRIRTFADKQKKVDSFAKDSVYLQGSMTSVRALRGSPAARISSRIFRLLSESKDRFGEIDARRSSNTRFGAVLLWLRLSYFSFTPREHDALRYEVKRANHWLGCRRNLAFSV